MDGCHSCLLTWFHPERALLVYPKYTGLLFPETTNCSYLRNHPLAASLPDLLSLLFLVLMSCGTSLQIHLPIPICL